MLAALAALFLARLPVGARDGLASVMAPVPVTPRTSIFGFYDSASLPDASDTHSWMTDYSWTHGAPYQPSLAAYMERVSHRRHHVVV